MTRLFFVSGLLYLLLGITSLSAAPPQARTAPTIDASLSFESGSNPQISPDGTLVAYQYWRTDWQSNTFVSDLWVASNSSIRSSIRLTVGQGSNSEAQWASNGKSLMFVSDRTGERQVWAIRPTGGEAQQLTDAENGVNTFHLSPDGKMLAFTTDGADPEESTRTNRYGEFEVVKRRGAGAGLWMARVPDTITPAVPEDDELISSSDYTVEGFAWSPDSTMLVFQADRARTKKPGHLYAIDMKSFDITVLVESDTLLRNPAWSPDGKWVAFEIAGSANFFYSNWNIGRVSFHGGVPEILTEALDENAELVAWTPRGILFAALERTASHLYELDPNTKQVRRLTGPASAEFSQFSVSKDGNVWAALKGDNSSFPEIVVGNKRLTDFGSQVRTSALATREVVRWQSADGTSIEGVLMKPSDFTPAKKYPLLVVLHGGPVSVDQPMVRADRTYPLEQFVARGALVLRPNYRGSAGYGAAMRALIVRNLGTGDAMDVIGGIDSLVSQGFVDNDRIGAMGWSQGGFIAAYLGTATDRFRAVSVGAGISDWLTYYANTDINAFTRQYMKATPWEEPEVYRKASPITYVTHAKTPMLIQHGDRDLRVPIPNAYELRQALEDQGVPVKMIVYKGFGHVIDRPRQQRALMEHNLDWFEEWLLKPDARRWQGKIEPAPAIPVESAEESANTGKKRE